MIEILASKYTNSMENKPNADEVLNVLDFIGDHTYTQAVQHCFIDLSFYQDYLVEIVDNLIACSKYITKDHIIDDFISLCT